jgi:hypothetical protein
MLEELKKYDLRVKLYYVWLKAKSAVSDFEIDKAYDMIMASITKTKQEELNRRF